MSCENGVLFQGFHYRYPTGGLLWNELRGRAAELAKSGFTAVWLPPPYKGGGDGADVGYGVYDLFDLGEFRKSPHSASVATKYGRRDELEQAVKALRAAGVQVYVDVVFNHKHGADECEEIWACEAEDTDRNSVLDCRMIRAWTRFNFDGRRDETGRLRYSPLEWSARHFDSADWDDLRQEKRVFRLKDKVFETEYDYLLGVDIDTREPEVDEDLRWWGRWIVDTLQVDGFRLDALKHIREGYFRDWLNHLRTHFGGRELFAVGEYWSCDLERLTHHLAATEGTHSLFDVPLHFRFRQASLAGAGFDLRTLADGSLVGVAPMRAVTFVDNHDTQPGESLESWVEPWFKPLAYAFILLRRDGYPCVFYGDYDGGEYDRAGMLPAVMHSHRFLIDRFLAARRDYGFGDQHDYFDHPNAIGWTRLGDAAHPGSMAVVMSNGGEGWKWMNLFRPHARYRDVTGHSGDRTIETNGEGWGCFPCPGGSVSVWVQE